MIKASLFVFFLLSVSGCVMHYKVPPSQEVRHAVAEDVRRDIARRDARIIQLNAEAEAYRVVIQTFGNREEANRADIAETRSLLVEVLREIAQLYEANASDTAYYADLAQGDVAQPNSK